MSNVIIVCGLNGAGKSSLAKALAEEMNYRFVDMEDLYFPKNNPNYLYSNPRSFEEAESILMDIVSEGDNMILALVKGNFNKEIVSHFKYAIYMEVPKEIRIQRVYERSYSKFGDRICKGGDLFEKENAFFNHVKSRDEHTVEDWLLTMDFPIMKIDGTLPIHDNVKLIAKKLQSEKLNTLCSSIT